MKTIVELTREAGGFEPTPEFLERLVALARADERKIVMNEPLTKEMWQRFEDEIRADEREACAKVCDDIDDSHWGCEVKASWCSREIRARGETK
jgi:hypothetical protein